MRSAPRLVLMIALIAMFCGVAALAEDPVPIAQKCNVTPPGQENGRGKGHIKCDPFCSSSCERVVCDGPGVCKWHCEPIPGCTPV